MRVVHKSTWSPFEWIMGKDEDLRVDNELIYARFARVSAITTAVFTLRLIVDCWFLNDGLRILWDIVFLVGFTASYASAMYCNLNGKRLVWPSMAMNLVVNGWIFYSANYFGRDGMAVLLIFCTAPYAYYIVGTRVSWLFATWLLLPLVNLMLLEFGDYNYFPNHKYLGNDLAWTRIMATVSSLSILISILFSLRLSLGKSEGALENSKAELLRMVERIESLTEIKEKNNTQLREQLQQLVDETKRISVDSSLEALRSEERERNRISYELIDGLGGLLLAMKYKFESFYPLVEKGRIDEYRANLTLVDNALTELYATCGYLQTEQLKQMGLIESLRVLLRAMEGSHRIRVDFVNDNYSDQLTNEQELIVYRMMVLMINNAAKYSNADNCKIEFKCALGVVYISLVVDGVEFTDGGAGINEILRQVRELVALVGGQVRHKSIVGKGASTVVQVPMAIRKD